MPLPRSFLFVTAAAVLSFAAGCTSTETAEDDVESQADELNALRSITILKGSVTEGGSITVTYEPDQYAPARPLPFLAIELLPAADEAIAPEAPAGSVGPMNGTVTAPLAVNVAGDFPGSPRVLVTDENFRVLAGARGAATPVGEEASLRVHGRGKRLILVRDMHWVAPMTFQVTTGR